MRAKNDERKMEVYRFVNEFLQNRGVCPTTQEIADCLGMAKSTVSKYMSRLEEEGLIEKYGRYQTKTADSGTCVLMPVVGSIACGQPILAIEDVEEYIPINVGLLGYGEYFGLIARGDSMIDAGICDGDTVYVRKQSTAIDGEIVVAMYRTPFSLEAKSSGTFNPIVFLDHLSLDVNMIYSNTIQNPIPMAEIHLSHTAKHRQAELRL